MMQSQRLSRQTRTLPAAGLMLTAIVGLLLCSCDSGPKGPPRKETIPVTGQVLVDGQPAADLEVALHDLKGIDQQSPTFPKAITDSEGKFKIGTYQTGDGAPEGEYAATFMWGHRNAETSSYEGPDKLRGRYIQPAASQNRVTVKKGSTVDMGPIQLTTK